MPQWIFRLKGSVRYLEDLPAQFPSTVCHVAFEQGHYNLTSTKLDDITDPHDALVLVRNMLAMMCASVKLRFGFMPKVELGAVMRVEQDGSRSNLVFPEGIESGLRVGIPTVGTAASPLPPMTAADMEAALHDSKIEKVFRILGFREHTWENLSKVLEVIQSGVGGGVTKAGWASKTELNRFTQTSNSAKAVGDDARHGHQKFAPPEKPMSLEEANELVFRVLRQWMAAKHQDKETALSDL
jgi:hypothetical protein